MEHVFKLLVLQMALFTQPIHTLQKLGKKMCANTSSKEKTQLRLLSFFDSGHAFVVYCCDVENQVFSQMFQKVRYLLLQFYLTLSRVIFCPRLKEKKILSVQF